MKWDIKDIKNWTWKEHPRGAVITDPGNSRTFKTGGWRTLRPIRDSEKCNNCLICFIYCPDSCIKVEDEKIKEIDLKFCKGCGICDVECPKEAIEMVDEMELEDDK